MSKENAYRDLQGVDQLIQRFAGQLPAPLLADVVRDALADARRSIADGEEPNVEDAISDAIRGTQRAAGVEVINATGVLLHTNLGRASWSDRSTSQASRVAAAPTNLEMDVDTGQRNRRGEYVAQLLCSLTGAEDALVVNNNAAALMLSLAATASGTSVAVARGELIEIGGSFRLPEVMEMSGAHLVEVGTTNKTRSEDFLSALQVHHLGALLKVHPSNYRVEGFTNEATIEELGSLAKTHDIPLIHDVGSGLLDANTPWLEGKPPAWLRDEPAVRQSLQNGSDLVTFSGDKLLGGPQAGIVVGSSRLVAALRDHPLTRALRIDGPAYAALGATLEAFANRSVEEIPFWRHALTPNSEIAQRANLIADALGGEIKPGESSVGAGSAPGAAVSSTIVVLVDEDHLYEHLLALDHPILTRREDGALVIDPRSFDPENDVTVVNGVLRCRS